jgi:hypothetical protein
MRSSSEPPDADLQRQPAALEAQAQHGGVQPDSGGPPSETIGRDRHSLSRLPPPPVGDCRPPRVERAAVPSPPRLMFGRDSRVPGNRAARGLDSGDHPLKSALAVSVSNRHLFPE